MSYQPDAESGAAPTMTETPPPSPAPTMTPALRVLTGRNAGESFTLGDGRLVIGRDEQAGIPLDDSKASREHVEVVCRDGRYQVKDLGSRNGTQLNDSALTEAVTLKNGDRIRIGLSEIEFTDPINRLVSLRVLEGTTPNAVFTLDRDRLTLGRTKESDIALLDSKSSKKNTEIVCRDGVYSVNDLGSRNGTFVNDQKIPGETALKPGDRIQIGLTVLEFIDLREQPAEREVPANVPDHADHAGDVATATETDDSQPAANDDAPRPESITARVRAASADRASREEPGIPRFIVQGLVVLVVALVAILVVLPAVNDHLSHSNAASATVPATGTSDTSTAAEPATGSAGATSFDKPVKSSNTKTYGDPVATPSEILGLTKPGVPIVKPATVETAAAPRSDTSAAFQKLEALSKASPAGATVAQAKGGSSAADTGPESAVRAGYERDIHQLLDTYCAKCHGTDKQKGDINFAPYKTGIDALRGREVWRKTFDKLSTQEMPPEKERQPEAAERQRLLAWLKSVRHLETPNPGVAVIRRLSRIEYNNTIRDLFGITEKVEADLPNDKPGEGFDNSVSPLLMEKYLLAADEISDRLITSDQMLKHFVAGQMDSVKAGVTEPGKPDGKERRFSGPGEVAAILEIPVEGTYTIRIHAAGEQAGKEPVRLGVRFDTQVVGEVKVTAVAKSPAFYTCTAQLAPGRTRFAVTFMNPLADEGLITPASVKPDPAAKPAPPTPLAPPAAGKKPAAPAPAPAAAPATPAAAPGSRVAIIDTIDLTGPPAKAATAAQRKLLVAVPGKDLDKRGAARQIIEPFAARAFRRPPFAEEIDTLLKVFDLADSQDEGFNSSVKLMLKAVLVSPQFLFRTPEDKPGANTSTNGGITAVGDYELATRLSYFLWATMPDDELLQLAHDGKLRNPLILEGQVRRLIKDPRSRALADTFAASWLGLDQLAATEINEKKFPQMTKALRDAMYEEGIAFFDGLLRDGGSVLDLLDCDYAYMNALTAKLYGVDSVKGAKMQKVSLTDSNRGGLIAMPAILMVTSRPDRTSPVKRGKWVLDTLFDAAPPPPPANVAPLEKQDTPENAKLTLREKTERHRTDAACVSCHRVMDPIGFGLENFDAIGRWRTQDDTGGFVDAIGELPGKQRFGTPSELKKILMSRKDEFTRIVVGKLLAFALGRRLSGYDDVVVDDLADEAARNHYQLDTMIVKIVASYPFLNRQAIH